MGNMKGLNGVLGYIKIKIKVYWLIGFLFSNRSF